MATGDNTAILDPVALPRGAATPVGETSNLGLSILKNSAAQVASRIFIALLRLVIAGMVVRSFGKSLFGEYSLIFAMLSIADWLVDFGTTEVFVRDICRERQQSERLLRILTAAKLVQVPAAFVTIAVIMVALRYPRHVLLAGLLGAANIALFAGVLVYRTIFKATLTMEREAAAELLSVVMMVPLTVIVCKVGGGLIALLSCYLISRAVFLVACLIFGKNQFKLSIAGVTFDEVRTSLKSCAAIGVIGFIVGGYETIDILVLSKLGSFSQVAYYSAAQKFVWPLLMVLTSVAGTFYPVIASYWPQASAQFRHICQRALETVLLLAGLGLCCVVAGAEFLMRLLGPDLVSGANALRILGVVCFVKAVTLTLGPVYYIVKAQKRALQIVASALLLKIVVITALAPRFGYMGVAVGALIVELCFTIPVVYLLQRMSAYRVQWTTPAKLALVTVLAALLPSVLVPMGTLSAAALAAAAYCMLAFATRAVRVSQVQSLLRWRTS